MKTRLDTREPSYPLRMPDPLRRRLEQAARLHKRSLHAEIIHRLTESFALSDPGAAHDDAEALLGAMEEIARRLRSLCKAGRTRPD